MRNFYPRSPCGERPRQEARCCLAAIFLSTLSLRRATQPGGAGALVLQFLSTLSLRRATRKPLTNMPKKKYFYPRSPCGERPVRVVVQRSHEVFLSTLSLRRATCRPLAEFRRRKISIHALLAESDIVLTREGTVWTAFLSTLSLRRATAKVHKTVGHFCAYETNFMEIASSC